MVSEKLSEIEATPHEKEHKVNTQCDVTGCQMYHNIFTEYREPESAIFPQNHRDTAVHLEEESGMVTEVKLWQVKIS